MSKLWIARGLPASGKSTWANEMVAEDFEGTIRVNRDKLREMAHNGEFVKGVTEQNILIARNALVEKFLKRGMTVIADDTNLARRNVVDLIKIANKLGVSWEIKDFTHVDVEECIRRDLIRPETVGAATIRNMYDRYLKGKAPLDVSELENDPVVYDPYVRDWTRTPAYVVDIDGTVALMNGRSPYDYTKVLEDLPNEDVLDTIRLLHNSGCAILFTSGRPDSAEEDTREWLAREAPGISYELFMRATGDGRSDYIVKKELFDKHIRHEYNVMGIFDDRKQVVEMWRKLGLTVFHVAEGDF